MHEVSLVAELIDECARLADGKPVSLVRVRHATSIPEPALRQAFDMLTADGPLAGAALEAETFEIRLQCGCGFDGVLGHDDVISGSVAVCPTCAEVSVQPRSAELELLELRTAGADHLNASDTLPPIA